MVLAVDDLPTPSAPDPVEALRARIERERGDAQWAGDDPARIEATTSLGTVLWRQGDAAGAVAAWRSVLPLLRTSASPEVEAAARLGLVRALACEGGWADAERHLDAMTALAARSGASGVRIRAVLARSELAERRGRAREALGLAESVWMGDPARGGPAVVRCCLLLGEVARAAAVVSTTADRLDGARVAAQRGEPVTDPPPELAPWLAAAEGRWDDVGASGVLVAWARLARGDADGALGAFDVARIARAADGWPVEAAICGLWSAGAMAAAGRARAAAALLAELEVLVDDADPEVVAASFDLARARVARATGDETTAAALAASSRARLAHPPPHVRVDLHVFHTARSATLDAE